MSPLLTFNLKVGFTFSVLSKYHVPTKMVYQLMNFVAFVEPSL